MLLTTTTLAPARASDIGQTSTQNPCKYTQYSFITKTVTDSNSALFYRGAWFDGVLGFTGVLCLTGVLGLTGVLCFTGVLCLTGVLGFKEIGWNESLPSQNRKFPSLSFLNSDGYMSVQISQVWIEVGQNKYDICWVTSQYVTTLHYSLWVSRWHIQTDLHSLSDIIRHH